MVTYWIWDRVNCTWLKVTSSLVVWRSIPKAVGTFLCKGAPLALLALPPGSVSPVYTPASAHLPPQAVAAAPYAPLLAPPSPETYQPLLNPLPSLPAIIPVAPPVSPREADTAGLPAPVVGERLPSIIEQPASLPPTQVIAQAGALAGLPSSNDTPNSFLPDNNSPSVNNGTPGNEGNAQNGENVGTPEAPPSANAANVVPEPVGLFGVGLSLLFLTSRFRKRRVRHCRFGGAVAPE